MYQLPTRNMILIDWITITSKIDSVASLRILLGMVDVSWTPLDHGFYGYRSCSYFDGVSLLSDGTDAMGVCCQLSGSGCRAFETYGSGDYMALLDYALSNPGEVNITRIDIAFDDHTGILDIDRLRTDTDDELYVSKSKNWQVNYGSEGTCIYHGSQKSDILTRIYDKSAERGYSSDVHWVRVELQLRRKNALAMAHRIVDVGLGPAYCGVLRNYLRYVQPCDDSNKRRWPMADYWAQLLGDVDPLRICDKPGTEYNLTHLDHYVIEMSGNAVDTYIKIHGLDHLIQQLSERRVLPNKKYEALLEQYVPKRI